MVRLQLSARTMKRKECEVEGKSVEREKRRGKKGWRGKEDEGRERRKGRRRGGREKSSLCRQKRDAMSNESRRGV